MSSDGPGRQATATAGRVSERGAATRGAILEAAKEVFVERGFAEAGVTEVVARANASVGSLYHHFSGKADLYLTLFEEFQDRQTRRTRAAVQEARTGGETDPMRLFIAGARAYLEGCLEERELAALFLRGDGPPGFEVVMRDRLRQWTKRNAALLQDDEGPLAVVITGAMAAAATEITSSEDETVARRLVGEVLEIVGRIR
ncbi:TetR/AcrR family transcriptional regulator [Thermostaphylospora chromogena]|uniref:DNA-binding transcriptional regulator, AcrR family n=1 Tax=Thermostaphylospora chromogena TaxID=35622 RepID=A0A1H1B479_9ACTN|nr:TetR/AcrR family transcriptional regulator [Thermostaphylospora chromogena]SDQ46720.1 DNA-binding transcriptional regulator, AcrR family [Thermostaphylospora chromogena]